MSIYISIRRKYYNLTKQFKRSNRRSLVLIVALLILLIVLLNTFVISSSNSKRKIGFFKSKQGLSYYEQELLKNNEGGLLETKLEASNSLKRKTEKIRDKLYSNSDLTGNPENDGLLQELKEYEDSLVDLLHKSPKHGEAEQEEEDSSQQQLDNNEAILADTQLKNSLGTKPKGNHPQYMKTKKANKEIQKNVKMQKYFKKVLQIVASNKPRLGFELLSSSNKNSRHVSKENAIPRVYGSKGIVNIAMHDTGPQYPVLSESFLSDCLKVPDELINELGLSHKSLVKELPDRFPAGIYQGNGIVFLGGGKFSWLSLLALENLRKIGSVLPVEFIIPTEREYEVDLCQNILPDLNAKCILLTDVLPDLKKDSFKIRGYQYKSIALLISSFKNVLLLDSDNVPVSNPDLLFTSEPFEKFGMIVWPDFWRRVTHPGYYQLTGTTIGRKRVRNGIDDVTPAHFYSDGDENPIHDIPLHDRAGAIDDPSSESGQILVNKESHMKALLLAFYYNFYGPQHYYPLFSQGGKGEGDKETFHAAAQFYNLGVYQVKKQVDVIGFWQKHPVEYYTGVGMIQYDPIVDYEQVGEYMEWFENRVKSHRKLDQTLKGRLTKWWRNYKIYDEHKSFKDWFHKGNSKPMFIHSNFPKLDPVGLRKENNLFRDDGQRIRMYRDQSGISFDFELRQWQIIKKYFCENGGIELNYLRVAGVSSLHYCDFINEELEFLMKTTDVIRLE